MPSPIIQQYLNDNSIDENKRRKLFDDLNAGKVDEKGFEQALQKKFGSKYGGQQTIAQSSPPQESPSQNTPTIQQNAPTQTPTPQPTSTKKDGGIMGSLTDFLSSGEVGQSMFGGGRIIRNKFRPKDDGKSSDFSDGMGNFEANTLGSAIASLGNQGAFVLDALDTGFNSPNKTLSRAMGQKTLLEQAGQWIKGGGEDIKRQVREKAGKKFNAKEDSFSTITGDISGNIIGALPSMYAAGGITNAAGITPQALKSAPWLQKVAGFLANSGINTTASTVASKGALPNTEDLVTGGIIDAVLRVPGGIKNFFSGKNKDIVGEAVKKGIDVADANFLKNLTPEQKKVAFQLAEVAQNKAVNREAPNVFNVAGKEIEDFVGSSKKKLDDIGKLLGTSKQNLLGKISNTQTAKNELQNILRRDLNAKIGSKGAIDWSNSEIAGNSQAISKFEELFNFLKRNKVDARDLEARTGQIDQLTGLLKDSGYKNSAANSSLSNAKSFINDAVGQADPVFKDLNRKYASLINDLKKVTNATRVKVGAGQYDQSGDQLLRRLLGNTPKKNATAIEAIQNIKKNFGVTGADDLNVKAHIADIFEKATGTVNPQSLAGITNSPAGNLLRKVPGVGTVMNVVDMVKDVKKIVKSQKAPLEKTTLLKNILASSEVPEQVTKKSTIPQILANTFKIGLQTKKQSDKKKVNQKKVLKKQQSILDIMRQGGSPVDINKRILQFMGK